MIKVLPESAYPSADIKKVAADVPEAVIVRPEYAFLKPDSFTEITANPDDVNMPVVIVFQLEVTTVSMEFSLAVIVPPVITLLEPMILPVIIAFPDEVMVHPPTEL